MDDDYRKKIAGQKEGNLVGIGKRYCIYGLGRFIYSGYQSRNNGQSDVSGFILGKKNRCGVVIVGSQFGDAGY